MSRRKPLRSLGDWIGAGGHSFDSSLLESEETASSPIQSLDIDQLVAGRYQPRQHLDEAYLAELAQSIRQFGVIEPLVARPLADGSYEILAGHMRWQAARRADLTQVPVVVREADDRTAAAIALVENLLRRELNPVEEGRALRRLREEFSLTQEQLAELLGVSQTAISRALGLLSLDPVVQTHIEEGRLDAGHGKTLLGLSREKQLRLTEQAVAEGWSVRELERRRAALVGSPLQPAVMPTPRDPNLVQLEERLRERLAAPVRLRYDAARGRGRIEIGFTNLDECDGILERLGMREAGNG
ncbi:MAG TPA: ParB/RepB/Spo0J family partition protein [Candidatus Competibacteraceae bacterium]|nr:ParB/RepB/Spo0J family partition protein [Candidatus Competibacteraceae bacterium]HRZ06635.1 ParB/RepB/Spo0J family partition protein [Candidatus Competibacteraceae bacterium]HSA47311.1 ParB/RepB/Spo0J family partition protein [Candidatus Competibacteraceae bacterium]